MIDANELTANALANATASPKWEKLIKFEELEVPEIPVTLLPDNLQEFAAALSKAAEISMSAVAASIISVLSIALARKFVVSPKEGWNEYPNTYSLAMLEPGSNKTFVLRCAIQPLLFWEKKQREAKEEEIKKQHSRRKSELKVIEGLRNSLTKKENASRQSEIIHQIEEKEAALTEPEHPLKLFANNVTPESLAADIYKQGNRFAIISDEGGVMETLAGLYTGGKANVDIILKGIDGGAVRITRKDYEYELNPHLTIGLIVQPQILLNLINKGAFRGNGFVERFLYFVPASNIGFRTHDNPSVPQQLQDEYNAVITDLLELQETDKPVKLSLSPDAQKEFKEFQKANERTLRPGGKLENCRGWGSKLPGYALRFAGQFHVCEETGGGQVISLKIMQKALDLASLLSIHAVAAFQLMGISQEVEDAKKIIPWLKTLPAKGFTKSDLLQAMKNKRFGKADALNKALQILIERNFVSHPIVRPSEGTKGITWYEINPALYES